MNVLPINIALASPTPVLTAGGSGATLPAASYFAKVVAKMAVGSGGPIPGTVDKGVFNNVAGAEGTVAGLTLGQTLTITIPYTGGATHYDIYLSTTTGTEVYWQTVQAAPNQANTVVTASAPLVLGSTTAASVAVVGINGSTSAAQLPGNAFYPGGNQGALYSNTLSGGPFYYAPGGPGTPFIPGSGRCIVVTTGACTIQASDGTGAFANWLVAAGAGYFDINNLNGFGRNLLVNGVGGLPPYLVANNGNGFLMGSP